MEVWLQRCALRHKMEVKGQLHRSAPLPQCKERLRSTGHEAGWALEQAWGRENSLFAARNPTPVIFLVSCLLTKCNSKESALTQQAL
jgi:hypothetical protein